MSRDRFEQELRHGLATLAREAVPVVEMRTGAGVAGLHARADRDPRPGRRAVALVVAVAVVLAAAGIAIALRRAPARVPPVEAPQPSVVAVPASPLGPRDSQVSVFTGKEVLIWGGRNLRNTTPATAAASRPGVQSALGDGAAFDIATRRWRTLAPAPIAARYAAVAVWTGSEMLVVAGADDGGMFTDGAAYDPARNRWRLLAAAPICVSGTGVWTGTRLVVGGNCAGAPYKVAAFDPRRDTWSALPAPPDAFQFVSGGGRLYAWNGSTRRGAEFEPSTQRWRPLPALGAPVITNSVAVAYDGAHLAVVGPRVTPAGETMAEAEVDLLADDRRSWRRQTTTKVDAPQDSVVAARDLLVWNGTGPSLGWLRFDRSGGDGVLSSVSEAPVSLERLNGTLLAIGDRRVFFWGGQSIPNGGSGTSQPSNDGAIVEIP